MEVFWARSGRTAWERLMESGGEGGGLSQELGVEWYRNKVASYQDKKGSGGFLDINVTVEGGVTVTVVESAETRTAGALRCFWKPPKHRKSS